MRQDGRSPGTTAGAAELAALEWNVDIRVIRFIGTIATTAPSELEAASVGSSTALALNAGVPIPARSASAGAKAALLAFQIVEKAAPRRQKRQD